MLEQSMLEQAMLEPAMLEQATLEQAMLECCLLQAACTKNHKQSEMGDLDVDTILSKCMMFVTKYARSVTKLVTPTYIESKFSINVFQLERDSIWDVDKWILLTK